MTTQAFVYRRTDEMPKEHKAAILSADWLGEYVIVYGDGIDSWHEWGGGFLNSYDAVAEVKRIWHRAPSAANNKTKEEVKS